MSFLLRLRSHPQDISLCACKYSKIKKKKAKCDPSGSKHFR